MYTTGVNKKLKHLDNYIYINNYYQYTFCLIKKNVSILSNLQI